jgi:hypothetical protein
VTVACRALPSFLLTHHSGFDQMIRMMGNEMSKWPGQREGREPFVQRTDASDNGAMVAPSIDTSDPTTVQIPTTRKPTESLASLGTSERADIARRVVAFRDRQRMIRKEREDYCNAVQAETRAALRDDRGIPRS